METVAPRAYITLSRGRRVRQKAGLECGPILHLPPRNGETSLGTKTKQIRRYFEGCDGRMEIRAVCKRIALVHSGRAWNRVKLRLNAECEQDG